MVPSGRSPTRQPWLHRLVTCVRAPVTVLSGTDGQIRAGGVQGCLGHDRRSVSELVVEVDGQAPAEVGGDQPGPDRARFVGVVAHPHDPGPDPTVRLERTRHVDGGGFREQLTLVNRSGSPVAATVRVRAAVDLAATDTVRHDDTTAPVPPTQLSAYGATWADAGTRVSVRADGAAVDGNSDPAVAAVGGNSDPAVAAADDGRLEIIWRVTVPARGSWCTALTVRVTDLALELATAFTAPAAPPLVAPEVSGPPELTPLLRRGVGDLAALTVADPLAPEDRVFTAGSPWYLTLFGRDALWAARLALPLDTGLAAGTLAALARRQGRRHDAATGEAPGKIPHEVRRRPQRGVDGHLTYYGTVDATGLWVCLLHDAWRWGMPAGQVARLLEPLEAALEWLLRHADRDATGFLTYRDATGRGLANQGWKDSRDAVQFPDGTLATPPVAVAEVQAYVYAAATGGAALLEAFGRPGAAELRDWAATLRARFRETFWVCDDRGRFPALARDGAGRPVDVAASNLGHLLGTGLLDRAEAAEVAARLTEPDLDCGHGLRTLSADATGFNPLGYHVGTVWPHDTAVAVRGLVREHQASAAGPLADGLLRAAPHFGHRLPELFGGAGAEDRAPPLAYPAACVPQAWSAASVVGLLQAALGLEADVPAGVLTVRPGMRSWWPLRVSGLRVAGHPLTVTVDSAGNPHVDTTAPVEVRPVAPEPVPGPPERVPSSVPAPRSAPASTPAGADAPPDDQPSSSDSGTS